MQRCPVCWLETNKPVCSDRCRRLVATKRRLYDNRGELADAVVGAVRGLKPKSTECPGTLAEKLASKAGLTISARDALACLREIYFDLRAQGKIRFYQKGIVIPAGKEDFRGPFRIGS
jgi:hypothetical protein